MNAPARSPKRAANIALLVSSLALLSAGAVGLAGPALHGTAPLAASDSLALEPCQPLTRHLVLWDSPVRTPVEHSGRVEAYLADDADRAWMNVTADSHTLADWSLAVWSPDESPLGESVVDGASGAEHVEAQELGPLGAGVYRFTWRQSGLVEDLRVTVVVRGCFTP